jgi:uncharacterized membrane protein
VHRIPLVDVLEMGQRKMMIAMSMMMSIVVVVVVVVMVVVCVCVCVNVVHAGTCEREKREKGT